MKIILILIYFLLLSFQSFCQEKYFLEITRSNDTSHNLAVKEESRIKFVLKPGTAEPVEGKIIQITKDSLYVVTRMGRSKINTSFPLSDIAMIYVKSKGAKAASFLLSTYHQYPAKRDVFKKIGLLEGDWKANIVTVK